MRKIKKLVAVLGIALGVVVLVFGGLILYFKSNIKPIFQKEINKILAVEVQVENIKVTGLADFPNLGIVFSGVRIPESTKHYGVNVVEAGELALYINLKKIWKGVYEVDEVKILDGQLFLADLMEGSNYTIIKAAEVKDEGPTSISFEIKKLRLEQCNVTYKHLPSKYFTSTEVDKAQIALKYNDIETALTLDGQLNNTTITYAGELYVKNKDLNLSTNLLIDTEKEEVKINPSKIKINEVKLSANGIVSYTNKSWMDIEFDSDETSCQSLLSVLPKSISSSFDHLVINGNIDLKGRMNGKTYGNNNPSFDLNYSVSQTKVSGIAAGVSLDNINGNGSLTIANVSNLATARATMNISQAKQKKNRVNGTLVVRNFNRPSIEWNGKAHLDLPTIISLSGAEDFKNAKGTLDVNGLLKLTVNTTENAIVPGSLVFKGNVIGTSLKGTWTNPALDLKQLDFNLVATTEDMVIKNATFAYNNSSGQLKAYIRDFNQIGSVNSQATLVGDLRVKSLNINDFFTDNEVEETENNAAKSNDLIPIRFQLKTTLDGFSYNDFHAEKISGNLSSNKKQVIMKNCHIDALEGSTKADIKVKRQGENFALDITGNMDGINITEMFKQFNNFEQDELTHEHLSGSLSGRINTLVILDANYEPILSKLYAKADVTIKDGQLKNYEPLNELSDYVEVKDLQNVRFKTLSNSIEIFEETITIPNMRIENNALNLSIEGTHTFENYMDYKMSLSIAELLASRSNWLSKRNEKRIEQNASGGLTAYITMTGTPDNLVIKYDKATAKEKVKQEMQKEKEKFKKALKGEGSLKDDEPKKNYDDVWDE